jgi:hypothetical protein
MKRIKNYTNTILVLTVFQMLFSSCNNYYKAVSSPLKNNADKAELIDSLRIAKRDFILRNGDQAFFMDKLVLSRDKTTMSCNLDMLSSFNSLHLTTGKGGKMQYKKHDPVDLAVLNEAHVYIIPDTAAAIGKYRLAIDKVQKVEVIEKDQQRTSNSYLLGGLAITAGAAIFLVVVGAALASSMSFSMGF